MDAETLARTIAAAGERADWQLADDKLAPGNCCIVNTGNYIVMFNPPQSHVEFLAHAPAAILALAEEVRLLREAIIGDTVALTALTSRDLARFHNGQRELAKLPPLSPAAQRAYERDRAIGDGRWELLEEMEEGERDYRGDED